MTPVIDNPILNGPFTKPGWRWLLDEQGISTGAIAQGRRRSELGVPVPPPQHITQGVPGLDNEYGRRRPNDIRDRVAIWRQNGHPGVTPVTPRKYWVAATGQCLRGKPKAP